MNKAIHKILIVEDNEVDRFLIRKLVEKVVADVHEAVTITEAKAKIAEHEYDLVLLDIRMPDGLSTDHLRHFYEIRPGLDILLVSGARPACNGEGIKAQKVPVFLHKDDIEFLAELIDIKLQLKGIREVLG